MCIALGTVVDSLCDHLKMLLNSFSNMDNVQAVQMLLNEGIGITPQCLKLAMMKVYKVDMVAYLKHIAAEEGIILSYRSRSEEARRMTALKK